MEYFVISGYAAVCILLFAVLRIPLNHYTVPSAAIGGIVCSFALIQVLNFYHPYSNTSRQHLSVEPVKTADAGQDNYIPLALEERRLVAWFPEQSLLRLKHGNEAEVTFASVPGRVFSGMVQAVAPATDGSAGALATDADGHSMIPVLIEITDSSYAWYVAQIPDGAHARAAVYGEDWQDLALVRKTLLRMSAWMNYVTPLS